MSAAPKSIDRILLGIVLTLVGCGFFIFSSASLGLLARGGASFSSVAFSQVVLGIGGGLFGMFIMSRIHYRLWRRYAFYIFLLAIGISLLVFLPQLGFEAGGARRWIQIGGFTFQPSEFLKIAFVIYMATWFSALKHHNFKAKSREWLITILPFLVTVVVVGGVMLAQKDTDTFLIMVATGVTMLFVQTGKWKAFLIAGVSGLILIAILAMVHPYVKSRLVSFVDPESDPRDGGYQSIQAQIAVGSGGLFGRGFGQSIQKFEYLPEPIGDAIFAVYAEEFGFIGAIVLILIFSAFIFRGFRLASHSLDDFGMLLVTGIITLIALQAFLHMAAMVQLAPVLGLPLPFISHGGTAMLVLLSAVGIVLNVSKYQKKKI